MVDAVDKVDIEIRFVANKLLYINIVMSTLYKYIYIKKCFSKIDTEYYNLMLLGKKFPRASLKGLIIYKNVNINSNQQH